MGDEVGSGTTSGGATVVVSMTGGGPSAKQVPTRGRVAAVQNSTAIRS